MVRREYPAAWDGPPDPTLALMVASGRTPTQSANASVEEVTQRKAPKKKEKQASSIAGGGEIVKNVKTLKTATPKATKSVRPHTEADAADSDSTKDEVRSV